QLKKPIFVNSFSWRNFGLPKKHKTAQDNKNLQAPRTVITQETVASVFRPPSQDNTLKGKENNNRDNLLDRKEVREDKDYLTPDSGIGSQNGSQFKNVDPLLSRPDNYLENAFGDNMQHFTTREFKPQEKRWEDFSSRSSSTTFSKDSFPVYAS